MRCIYERLLTIKYDELQKSTNRTTLLSVAQIEPVRDAQNVLHRTIVGKSRYCVAALEDPGENLTTTKSGKDQCITIYFQRHYLLPDEIHAVLGISVIPQIVKIPEISSKAEQVVKELSKLI